MPETKADARGAPPGRPGAVPLPTGPNSGQTRSVGSGSAGSGGSTGGSRLGGQGAGHGPERDLPTSRYAATNGTRTSGTRTSGTQTSGTQTSGTSTYHVGRDGSVHKLASGTRTAPSTGADPSVHRTELRRPRPPRRATLLVQHISPWSVLRFSLVLSVALFMVWMIAVGLLYGVLARMGVWDNVNNLYDQLAGGDLITAKFVLTSAAVVGAVNILLFTALATVGAVVYNICADLVGGLTVTLSEHE